MQNKKGRGFLNSIVYLLLSCLCGPVNAAYYLELGAFRNQSNAQKIYEKSKLAINKNITIRKSKHGKRTLYFIKAGPFATIQEVNDAKRLASQAKLTSFIFNHKQMVAKSIHTNDNRKTTGYPHNRTIAQSSIPPAISINEVDHYHSQDNSYHLYPIIYNDFAYFIKLGEYKKQTDAEAVYMSVYDTFKMPGLIIRLQRQVDSGYRVQIGPFATMSKANSFRKATGTELAFLANIKPKIKHNTQSNQIMISVIPKLPNFTKLAVL